MDHLDAHGSAGPDLRGVASAFRRTIADGLMCAAMDDLVADAPRVIAEAVNADLVLLTRLHRHSGILETVSCYDVHGRVSSFAYEMRGTPCEVVATMRGPVSFARAVQRTFPDDADLRRLDLHAYAGAPLLDADGEVFGLVCVLWSLERPDAAAVARAIGDLAPRLAREAMRRVERDAHGFWDHAAAHGLWRIDLRSATVSFNAMAQKILGFECAAHPLDAPESPFFWIDGEDPAITASLRASVREGVPLDIVCRAPGGAEAKWLRLVGRAQRGPTGSVEIVAGSVSDVSDLVEARRTAAAAHHAQSAFLANMSHEMRTPLNGVVALADLLCATPLDPRHREMVEMIRASGQMLERLVNDALDLAKIEAGKIELTLKPFDIQEAVAAAVHPSRLLAERKGLVFDVRFGAGATGAIVGDELRWRQVVANLASNAVKFTTAGRVDVEIDVVPTGGDDAELRIDVTDTGPGFDPADAPRLFRRFEQGGPGSLGGAGLGLTISCALVEAMGGVISATAKPGNGATFVVRAPVRRCADQDAASAAEPELTAVWDRPPRILLAEDNPATQRVMELVLESIGASVHIVPDGARAVDAFSSEAFDLVLMDMAMPVLNGLDATRAIRAAERAQGRSPIPILMLSANALPDHVESARAAGCDVHIAKPISPARVLDAIAQRLAARAA